MVDEDDLAGAQQPLADRQRADLVVGDDAAGVADDVGITFLEAESSEDIYIDQYCFVSSKEVSDAFTNTSLHTDYDCNLAIY